MSDCEHHFLSGACVYCERTAGDIERIAELEAELASERTLAETAWRANADLVSANEKAEAEVERLTESIRLHFFEEHDWTPTWVEKLERGGRESGAATQERVRLSSAAEAAAAANPAAPSLSARKATRKTDDAPTAPCPNCGAELTWFKHAWARKERDG